MNDNPYFLTNKFFEMIIILVEIWERFMLIMDDSR
jgi:hypothetical protein